MQRRLTWLALAAASIGLLIFASYTANADDPAGAPRREAAREASKPLAFPAGFTAKDGTPSEGIRNGLAKLTERAVTKGDYNAMLAELSKPDRERAREFKGADQAKLDAQIDRVRAAWKSKYGKDFAIDAKAVFGAPVQIIEGEVSDPAQALANWPVPTAGDQAITASGNVNPNAGDNKEVKKEARQEKLEKGRNVALVRLTGERDMPDLTVSMIHHLPAFWRVSIPESRTGEQIYNDLLTQLTWLGDHTDRWPTDMTEGGRVVAYRVAAALYGVDFMGARKG